MSGILDLIKSNIGDGVMEQIAGQMGGDKGAVQKATAAALPALLGALQRNANSSQGAESLANALDRDHDGGVLANLGGLLGQSQSSSMGEKILSHVLGSKKDALSQQLGQMSGLDSQQAGGLLASLAPVVMGALGKAKKEQGLDASGLQNMLNAERSELEKQPQAGLLAGLLDADGDGDVDASDLLKKGSDLLGGFFK